MKITQIIAQLLILLLINVLVSSCGKSNSEIFAVNPKFNKHISGYTSGMINRKGVIRIELVNDISTSLSEKELNQLLTFEPKIKGKTIVVNQRLIEFIPSEILPVNQFYDGEFKLDKIAEVASGFKKFSFQFATAQQKITTYIKGLRSVSEYNYSLQKLEGDISLSDFEEINLVRKTLKIDIDGKPLRFKLERINESNSFNFSVDNIAKLDEEQTIHIKWDGASIQSYSKGQESIKVTALGDFTLSQSTVIENEDQMVELRFTEPILSSQNLEGLIAIEGINNLSFKVNRNLVTVYLPNRLEGIKKLTVSAGIKNTEEAKMLEEVTDILTFQKASPQIRLKSSGSILPNSQGLIFPFEAIALKAVDVRIIRIYEKNVHHFLQVNELNGRDELTRFGKVVAEEKINLVKNGKLNLNQWNTHVINLEKLINAEPGAIYQVALKFERAYTTCDCDSLKMIETEKKSTQNDWNERNWHQYGFNGYSTWSYGRDQNPCEDAYYYGKAIKRNILASNIGMIFKLDEAKNGHVFLSDMVTTNPTAGATVYFYDYAKKLIASVKSNEKGMARVHLKRKPFIMIAKKGRQRAYLKLTDGHVNSLSKFDVSGQHTQKGLKGFLYAERSVWRPGDSLFINFILQDQNATLPKNHPIGFKFYDPSGNVIYEKTTAKNSANFYDFRTATTLDSPTGSYRAIVSIGNRNFVKSFKVETVKANRLKIDLEITQNQNSDSCRIIAKWLHGASAKGLRANVQVQLKPMRTRFKGFKNYVFDSPIRSGSLSNKTIFNGKLNASGESTFKSQLSTMQEASGMLQAQYTLKVYEKSGEFSIDRKMNSHSPFNTYVGLQAPNLDKYGSTLTTNKKQTFQVVTLNKEGKLKSTEKLHVKIYKVDWNWWYDGTKDFATFTARNGVVLYKEINLSTENGKSEFSLNIPDEEYGKYLIIITDKNGGHQTGQLIHFDWPYWSRANRSNTEFASMLNFATNKQKYVKGEMVKVSFPSSSSGRALITVETSEKILKKFWVKTQKGETKFEFSATASMAPNAFVHVALLQAHNMTKNDMPIRMYGVIPILVNDPNTHLKPMILMKDKIRPESKTAITVKEKNGKKMTYTLAIVDEGLLDITNFKTPNPWSVFYAKEALGIKTWDLYDDVIGAYAGKLNHLISIGGDGEVVVGDGPKANRFKPMVRFLGPFELPAGGAKKHIVNIPNYVGSVRVMVIARDKQAYGKAQKTVAVKKPLMLLATVPRVIGPNEDFVLPVTIFAMEKNIKNVQVKVTVNSYFELKNGQKSIQFSQIGDEVVNFSLKTKNKVGVGRISITARSGNEISYQEIEIDVRPSNPVIFDSKEFQLKAGELINTNLLMDGLIGTNRGIIEISTSPPINLEKRLDYLIQYPHGCVEQTTSSVFPQLFLDDLVSLNARENRNIANNIRKGLKRLQLFQTSDGGFSYWPGEVNVNSWGTNYAGHFMLEAELKGYRLPANMKQRWLKYQKKAARNWTLTGNKSNQLGQAYRLYLLALSNHPEVGAMNRLREERELSNMAKWRLASAYAIIGQVETAKKMIKSAKENIPTYRELSNSFGSDLRDKSIVLEVHSILDNHSQGVSLLKEIAGELNSKRWMSTQETAYSLLSIAKFCQLNSDAVDGELNYSIDGKKHNLRLTKNTVHKITVPAIKSIKNREIQLKNAKNALLFVTLTVAKIPKVHSVKKEFSNLKMWVKYTNINGKEIDASKIKQGTEFIAEVKLWNPSKTHYKEMALNQLFPSGWEIHNTRLYGNKGTRNKTRYQDIRDDRVLSYYSLRPNETKIIKIILNATYKGRFFLPAVYTEAMYDHSIHAQLPGRWVEVF